MTAAQLLRQQIDLANTAHQREVADLQAAGLNPVLSANTSGAAVPNLSGFATSSGSSGGSGGSSARSALKLAKANPINKVMETADHAIDAVSKLAEKQNSAKVVMQLHPERQAAADAGLNELVQNIANYSNQSTSAQSNFTSNLVDRALHPFRTIRNGLRNIVSDPRGSLNQISQFASALGLSRLSRFLRFASSENGK